MPGFISALAAFCHERHGRVSELAAHLGIAQPHVSAWLSGRQQPSGEHTLQIQAWLAAHGAEPPAKALRVRQERKRTIAEAPAEEEPGTPVWLL